MDSKSFLGTASTRPTTALPADAELSPTDQILHASASSSAARSVCVCGIDWEEGEDTSDRMECAASNCTTRFFHTHCMGLDIVPRDGWLCEDCETETAEQEKERNKKGSIAKRTLPRGPTSGRTRLNPPSVDKTSLKTKKMQNIRISEASPSSRDQSSKEKDKNKQVCQEEGILDNESHSYIDDENDQESGHYTSQTSEEGRLGTSAVYRRRNRSNDNLTNEQEESLTEAQRPDKPFTVLVYEVLAERESWIEPWLSNCEISRMIQKLYPYYRNRSSQSMANNVNTALIHHPVIFRKGQRRVWSIVPGAASPKSKSELRNESIDFDKISEDEQDNSDDGSEDEAYHSRRQKTWTMVVYEIIAANTNDRERTITYPRIVEEIKRKYPLYRKRKYCSTLQRGPRNALPPRKHANPAFFVVSRFKRLKAYGIRPGKFFDKQSKKLLGASSDSEVEAAQYMSHDRRKEVLETRQGGREWILQRGQRSGGQEKIISISDDDDEEFRLLSDDGDIAQAGDDGPTVSDRSAPIPLQGSSRIDRITTAAPGESSVAITAPYSKLDMSTNNGYRTNDGDIVDDQASGDGSFVTSSKVPGKRSCSIM